MEMIKKAVVLLSGGLDSTTTLAIAKNEGHEIYAMSFDYGQRHRFELQSATRVATGFNVKKHIIIKTDLNSIGGSALTDNINVPKDRLLDKTEIPVTYVPARNTIFLAFALGWAEVLEAQNIYIGVNSLDYSGYPDCRPEFIEAFQQIANVATKAGVEGRLKIKIKTPLLYLTKAQIIKKGIELGVDYGLTLTCYDPGETGISCGRCDSCILRQKGFKEAGINDPLAYQA